MLENVRIVLVNPSHPGNIGSSARAMKTMGLMDLSLVAPKRFPAGEATALATGANDILENAQIVPDLKVAIADCHYVVGTSARVRGVGPPLMNLKEAMGVLCEVVHEKKKTAIVFGREDSGLTNNELACCQVQLHIPTNEKFSSLNLAAAVQVVCYELRGQALNINKQISHKKKLLYREVTAGELTQYYEHLYTTLVEIGFLEHSSHEKIMNKLRRLYDRAGLNDKELAILRGILSQTQAKLLDNHQP